MGGGCGPIRGGRAVLTMRSMLGKEAVMLGSPDGALVAGGAGQGDS